MTTNPPTINIANGVIELYYCQDSHGVTQERMYLDIDEAKGHAQRHSLAVVAHQYTFSDSELVEDFSSHWHVGHHTETYMPDNPEDIGCFRDPEEARTSLVEQLRRAQDALPDCLHDSTGEGCERHDCKECLAFQTIERYIEGLESGNTSVEYGARCAYNDGRSLDLVHWIEVVPATDCECPQDTD